LRAEIVSVGTELLLGDIVDTNAARLARRLSDLGISVFRRTTVGDNHDRLLRALRQALQESDIVLTLGGLGPTQDDITRETLAEAMEDSLQRDPDIAERLRAFFKKRSIEMPESVLRQAMVPGHGRALQNPNGTAPGLLFERNGKAAVALPGPPGEFLPMMENELVPLLLERTGGRGTIRSRTLRICGIGESLVEERIKDLLSGENPTVAPYAKTGEVHVRVTARADDEREADALIAGRVDEIRRRLGAAVYGEDGDTLETAVVKLLDQKRLTVATAESCTGGLLASRITNVPGSSRVFPGGVISYGDQAKTDLVSVPEEVLAAHGAVSAEVAQRLAAGARARFHADYGVGITGIAGPEGGTPRKPVGLVYICVADGGGFVGEENRFLGDRQEIRYRAAQWALILLRNRLLSA
jgi:nicotinamide-nucleotide amidase